MTERLTDTAPAAVQQEAATDGRATLAPAQPAPPTNLRRMTPEEWRMIAEQSQVLEAAGKGGGLLPKGVQNQYQIAAIVMKGHELGLTPMYSLEQITLVNGKPVIQGQGLAAIIMQRHGPGAIQILETSDDRCVVRFSRPGAQPLELVWDLEMAKQAGLLDKQGPWRQYPRVMLRWRCIGEGARVYFADTIAGIYLPDELDVPLRVEGENIVIDVEALAPPRKEPAPADSAPNTAPTATSAPIEGEVLPAAGAPEAAPVEKPISDAQAIAITKLQRMLGRDGPVDRSMGGADAGALIKRLSAESQQRAKEQQELKGAGQGAPSAEPAPKLDVERMRRLREAFEPLATARGQKESWQTVLRRAGGALTIDAADVGRIGEADAQTLIDWATNALTEGNGITEETF